MRIVLIEPDKSERIADIIPPEENSNFDHIKNNEFSDAVPDYKLAGRDGLEVCREIREAISPTSIVFFTADGRNRKT